ncbi:lysoplasmalogenase [Caulobacter soli]|uniref:lysoplasmalogenase n=1 Tax=Caulobacter soli TaxID=2708539 RepID=UPI0013EA8245|nr:lysoplasmalogenase family protein [Caulobacter soli]
MVKQSARATGVLIASVVAGVTYVAAWDQGLPQAVELTWKGLGVGLLAVYAALNARSLDGWLLVAVMAFGTLGDVLLGAAGLTVGALAFLAGHLVAIGLYLRNRRPAPSRSQLALAVLLVPAVVIVAFLLPTDRAGAPGVALYSLGLALMAASAWLSRFPRYRVGIGALMFVVSDLLIFGRDEPGPGHFATGLAVWGLYYFGQVLICVGVVRALKTPLIPANAGTQIP